MTQGPASRPLRHPRAYRLPDDKPHGNNQAGRNSVEERRLQAQARCDALNEDHRRWLHSGRWASKVPQMQAAEQGEAAQALKGKGSR